jgi:membrane protein implicated in regulation of membrane protease activity
VTLIGLLLGMYCAKLLSDSVVATWITFIILTVIHVWANWRAMRVLVLNTINRQRAQILCDPIVLADTVQGHGMM